MTTSKATPDLHVGTVLRNPDLASKLGVHTDLFEVTAALAGGMGVCFQIRSPATGALYALKTLRTDLAMDRQVWERFVEEAKVWITLSSCSGVVEALCITRVNETPCVCARWMEGGSLRSLAPGQRTASLYLQTATRVVRTLAWVQAQHAIIHRDLKPENLLLDAAGVCYIGDWGLAKSVGLPDHARASIVDLAGEARPALTSAGQFLGTILYASPEQIQGLPGIDFRADIYSLGCLLYEWETGSPPFTGRTLEELASKHLHEEPTRLGGLFRRTRLGLEEVIRRCLAKEPRGRFSSYSDLESEILRAASRHGVSIDEQSVCVETRYNLARVGTGQFAHRMKRLAGGTVSADGRHALIDLSELESLQREADALIALGKCGEAIQFYERLFVPELIRQTQDVQVSQAIAVNYAHCLTAVGKSDVAIDVLRHLDGARNLSAEYFVNLSHAYLQTGRYAEAERAAASGLRTFPGDRGLVGNLLIAQTVQQKHVEALRTAELRLSLGRDVKALEEVGGLHFSLGRHLDPTDWPRAAVHLKTAADLLREARKANPRYAVVKYILADIALFLGRYGTALEELTGIQGLEVDAALFKQRGRQVAACLEAAGHYQQCIEFCDAWLAKRGKDLAVDRIRARAFVDGYCIGHTRDGVRIVERTSLEFFRDMAVDRERRSPLDVCYFARLKAWMGESDDGVAALRAAAAESPQSWELQRELAEMALHRGHAQDALARAHEATRLAPWKAESWASRARAERALGIDTASGASERRAQEIRDARRKAAEELGTL